MKSVISLIYGRYVVDLYSVRLLSVKDFLYDYVRESILYKYVFVNLTVLYLMCPLSGSLSDLFDIILVTSWVYTGWWCEDIVLYVFLSYIHNVPNLHSVFLLAINQES